MKLAYFSGCKLPFYQKDYDRSFKAVMSGLDVELVELKFNCCGRPARNENIEISMLSAIKNLALAEKNKLDIITPCKCCFGQLKHALYWYDAEPELKRNIDRHLSKEGLTWNKEINVFHLISFIVDEFGLDAFQQKIKKQFSGLRLVVQYGCHALRPFSITGFDNPFEPNKFEQIMNITGMEIIDWSQKTECCGNPVRDLQPDLSIKITEKKLRTARALGADMICTACTHCQNQYEMLDSISTCTGDSVEAVLITQVIGIAMGLGKEQLSQTGNLPQGLV